MAFLTRLLRPFFDFWHIRLDSDADEDDDDDNDDNRRTERKYTKG